MKNFTRSFFMCLLLSLVSASIFARGLTVPSSAVDAQEVAAATENDTSFGTVKDTTYNSICLYF